MKTIRSRACALLASLSLAACGGSSSPDAGGAAVNVGVSPDYRLGGTARGVASSTGLTLIDHNAGSVALSQEGSFWFEKRLATGTPFSVQLQGITSGAYCTLANATGVIPQADVATIQVTCQSLTPPAP